MKTYAACISAKTSGSEPEGLTFVNLVGNTLAAIVISKWEGALDKKVLAETVGIRSLRNRYLAAENG